MRHIFHSTTSGSYAVVKKILAFFLIIALNGPLFSQNEDAFFLRDIYDTALTEGECYEWLRHLCQDIGPRLAGSPGAEAAVFSMQRLMDTLGFDTVYLQPCMAPRWDRGAPASGRIVNNEFLGTQPLNVIALGNTVGTGPDGITAPLVEVKSLEEVEILGEAGVAGKIVFFNRPMDPRLLNTFAAYGGAVDQRALGLVVAARYGARAVLVRSMTNKLDDVPHTGSVAVVDTVPKIPALSVSTNDAEQLSRLLGRGEVKVHLQSNGQLLPPVKTYNVIGEIRGTTHPEEIILVGGHLDSWDVGEGAHDDGTGIAHSLQVYPLLKKLGYRPQRTFRCVLFMNEENGLAGGRAYWAASNERNEFHLAAIESDRGGFTPRGFSAQGREDVFTDYYAKISTWLPLLEPYGLTFTTGGSGADISGLKSQGGLLMGFVPDAQRYFDFHHTPADVFEAVNKRELELGAASITAMVYLIDKYGLR
ncbi:M28 family peptidase [Lewinella sp. W8]|uniref:M28 family peptidase n=1 Tax=Lewinella sp. W8 TaxID=2528208 RepID=UPI001068919E|nr:M28 family peptidase [Lewinella sp. W8]MTB49613.1 M28 family peptidase [Lewinella sp. W8]